MITCGTQIVSGAPVNGGGGSSAPSGTGIVSVTDGVYDMPGVTTADLAAAFAGLGLSAVLAGCSSYLAFTSLADTSVFTGGLTRAVGTLTGVDNQALGVPVGTRFAVSFSGGGAQAYGGIYIVTNAGSVSTQPVITRAAEFDSSADFAALSDAGWPCGDSGLLRLSTTGGTTLDTSPVEFDVALGAVALEALIAAAIPASTLTTRGDLLRRGASAAERVAIGAAGTRLRSDGTDPVWSEPDVVCTAAELATTYAPSAALRGVIAYTTDTLSTYVCRRTAASTYAWALLAAGADAAAARLSIAYDYPADSTAYLIARLNDASGNPTLRVDPGGVTAAVAGTWVYESGGVYRDRGGMRHDEAGATSDCLSFTGLSVDTSAVDFTITAWVNVATPNSGTLAARYFMGLWSDNTSNPASGAGLGRAGTDGSVICIPRRSGSDTGIPATALGAPFTVPVLYGISWDRASTTFTYWVGGMRSTAGASMGGNLGTLTTLTLGNVRVRNQPTNGTYGEVRIYKSILTAAQMAQLAADHARV